MASKNYDSEMVRKVVRKNEDQRINCNFIGNIISTIVRFISLSFLSSTMILCAPLYIAFMLIKHFLDSITGSVSNKILRYVDDGLYHLMIVFLHTAILLFRYAFGIKMFIKGELPEKLGSNLILSNHQTNYDWLYIFALYYSSKINCRRIRIFLKESLRKLYPLNIYNRFLNCCYLGRNYEQDVDTIIQFMQNSENLPGQDFMFFPEGYLFSEKQKPKSDEFAIKNNLPTLNYLLYPRYKGLELLVKQYHSKNNFSDSNIVDLTITFTGDKMVNESDILKKKNFNVFLDLQTFKMKEIFDSEPNFNDGKLKTKLFLLWQQKELKINDFYQYQNTRIQEFKDFKPINISTLFFLIFISSVFFMILKNLFTSRIFLGTFIFIQFITYKLYSKYLL